MRGRDIKRYGYNWANLWLINIHNGIKGKLPRIDINEYPAIKVHLDQYWDKIKDRMDQGDTPYNLRNCAYMDKSKIKEWERQIQELGEEAAEVINEVVETIIGGTAEDIAKELGDAFIEAFLEGEDAAKAWGEKVDEIVADIMKQMLVSKFVEERIGDIFDQYKSKWFKDGVFVGIDGVIDSMGNFADDLNKVGEEFQAIWDSLPAETKELLGNAGAARQEATERGFQTMSQDTGDELNGRFTDIQGKITDIRGYVMAQTQSIIGLLTSMANIETAMYACVQVNNELLRYAVMTYMEIVEINGSTKNIDKTLVRIEEGINSIKKNTENI